MITRPLVLATLFCAAGHISAAAAETGESFEGPLPETISSGGGTLAISTERVMDGKQSLRWHFGDGDAFVIRTGPLGNVNVYTGYGGYSRSSLTLPVCLTTLGEGHLLIEVRAGDDTAATITVPFAHVGWQKLIYHYSWQSKMQWTRRNLADKLDNLRVSAHGVRKPTHAFFDGILFNTPRDFRDARSAVTQAWAPATHDFSNRKPPSADDLAKVDALARALVPAPEPKAPPERWRKRVDQLRQQIRQEGWHRGMPVTKGLAEYFGVLNGIADDWCRCADPALRQELADAFHTVNDWLQDQGLVVNGALGKSDNYVGRTYVDAITKMRAALEAHGNLEPSISYLKWSYGYDDQVFGLNHHESMDYFHNEALRLLRIALSHGDLTERWHHVSAFCETLGRQLVASIKPDGAIFHHGFHYFAYGSMGMNSISGTLAVMSGAGLPVERAALDKVRLAVMQMRWYSGGTTLWSLSGRAAHGTMQPPAGAFLNLAKAYAPYQNGKPDPELIGAYLRLNPAAAKNAEFVGSKAESAPNGFKAMPYAALAMHRRGDWLVGVKGYSKYAASGESYANANRHGLYMSMGQMEILSHPQPLPTVLGSGARPNEGYDWCAIEGATTVHAPLDRIANGNGTRIPYSPETFVGAVHNGTNGMFAMRLANGFTAHIMRDRPKGTPAPEPLRALKSWFCFDNRVICLGSNITTKGVAWPVNTTLFQRYLTDGHADATVNGERLTLADKPIVRDFSGRACMLVDPYGNAYFTTAESPLRLSLAAQKSRNADDQKDTSGNYATAWLEHGENPESAGYEYAVLVQPEVADLEAFDPAEAYKVLRKDGAAHVVRDHGTKTTGYAVFDARDPLPENGPVVSVSAPCLVMVEEHADHIRLSVCDPDIRPDAKEPVAVTLCLRSRYLAAEASSSGDQTRVVVTLAGAESQTLRLERVPTGSKR